MSKGFSPRRSESTGTAEFTPPAEGASCNVNAANIHGVTTEHIHGIEQFANCVGLVT